MKRIRKNTLIWLMFGIYLGTFIARAVSDLSNTGIFDWILIAAGVVVAIIHYMPDQTE